MQPIEPTPPEEQVNPEDPFFLLPMETVAEANSRRSRLLNRPANAITEVLRRSLISGNGIFSGPNGSPARSVLEFLGGYVWYTISCRVFTNRGFVIPLNDLTWFTNHRMDSYVLQPNGQYLPSANNINAPLQFSQLLDDHPNHLRPPGYSLTELVAWYSRSNCIIAGFMDRVTGTFRVLAETTTAIPPNAEWLAPYNPLSRWSNNWLMDTSAFDWNGSSPSLQANFLVHCLIERKFDVEDVALLAIDFVRRDYRDLDISLPISTWVPHFIGNYVRTVHEVTRRPPDYWHVFLANIEIQNVPAWDLLWGWGRDMDTWMRTQCGWSQVRRIGPLFSEAWWSAFEGTYILHRDHPAQPYPHGYQYPDFGSPGTGYNPDERPYGMPELHRVNYTTFH